MNSRRNRSGYGNSSFAWQRSTAMGVYRKDGGSTALAEKFPVAIDPKKSSKRRPLVRGILRSQKAQQKLQPVIVPTNEEILVKIQSVGDLETDHHFYTGFSNNIDDGGIFYATFDPYPIGTNVAIQFPLSSVQTVVARGCVQFVRERNVLSDENQMSGMGIRFTELREVDKESIEAFITTCHTVFYVD